MEVSPSKRRALAPLSVNAPSPNSKAHLKQGKQPTASPLKLHRDVRPLFAAEVSSDPKKRTLAPAGNDLQPAKKPRLEEPASALRRSMAEANLTVVEDCEEVSPDNSQTARQQSASPDASSIFDSSGLDSTLDTSQATAVTEPDMEGADVFSLASLPPLQPRRIPTREESRQKAEIIKLRLTLASYKLRTGQADVPLEQLQMRPYPSAGRRVAVPIAGTHMVQPPSSASHSESQITTLSSQITAAAASGEQERLAETDGDKNMDKVHAAEEDSEGEDVDGRPDPSIVSPEKQLLPRMPSSAAYTPQRRRIEAADERLTSSALRGGAASGLLSLSRS
ncbi:hypothetical protein NKR23_g10130 [Pleurostoma richardsiae]|uniref:Uncharacterized protein n=1 Tax=Pleurostoma richardsiae TaxID=41990 RepID=A0AA38RL45_9PEZI|nr:hypothetical protein NKR23_g10130 [Pleurostoma richardsiae]